MSIFTRTCNRDSLIHCSDKVDAKVELKVPDLPTNLDNKEKHKKEKTKTKKHLIEAEDDLFKPDPAVSYNFKQSSGIIQFIHERNIMIQNMQAEELCSL